MYGLFAAYRVAPHSPRPIRPRMLRPYSFKNVYRRTSARPRHCPIAASAHHCRTLVIASSSNMFPLASSPSLARASPSRPSRERPSTPLIADRRLISICICTHTAPCWQRVFSPCPFSVAYPCSRPCVLRLVSSSFARVPSPCTRSLARVSAMRLGLSTIREGTGHHWLPAQLR